MNDRPHRPVRSPPMWPPAAQRCRYTTPPATTASAHVATTARHAANTTLQPEAPPIIRPSPARPVHSSSAKRRHDSALGRFSPSERDRHAMRAHARLRLYSPSLYAASKQLAGKPGRSCKETGPVRGRTDGSAAPLRRDPLPPGAGSSPCAVPGTGPNRGKLRGNGIKRQKS
jgi:hypothetical protein